MKITKDTLEVVVETWDDPGDYPNAIAAGPLPSRQYLEGMDGEIVFQLTPDEYAEFQETIEEESLGFWVNEETEYRLPYGILSIVWQLDKTTEQDGFYFITLSVVDCEADPDQPADDGPDHI